MHMLSISKLFSKVYVYKYTYIFICLSSDYCVNFELQINTELTFSINISQILHGIYLC